MVVTGGTIAFIILFGIGKLIARNSHHIPHPRTTEILNIIAFFLFLAAGTMLVGAGVGRWPVELIHLLLGLLPAGGWAQAGQAVLVVLALGMFLTVIKIATMRETTGGGGGGMRGGGGGGVSGAAMRVTWMLPIVLAAVSTGALAVIWVYMQHYAGMLSGYVTGWI